MGAYEELEQHFVKIGHLQHVGAIVGWDEAAMMPAGAGEARGEAMATLFVVVHEMITDQRLGAWLADAENQTNLSDWQQANLGEMRKAWRHAVSVPSDLVAAKSKATSRCEQLWRELRGKNDWPGLLPLLKDVINLTRQEARLRAQASQMSPYDALLELYEPGMTSEILTSLFDDLKQFLPDFIDQVLSKQSKETRLDLPGPFPIEKQRALGLSMMKSLGFDFDHGRLDVSHHPFCGGVPDDVRITTRYTRDNFIDSLMAVLHETGHAVYQQGLPSAWRNLPVGEAVSAGTHESQSLLMEMQACRTREFVSHMAPVAQRIFLGAETRDPAWGADNLYRLYTVVAKDYIRVDADEVTYPLHVILRFELEQALVTGDLEVEDLPDAWDQKMTDYLGLSTKGNFKDGCMQDVHWQAGLFGYFPTYSIGAMTAAQLFAAANRAVPGILEAISQGDFSPLLGWLRENIHSKGRLLSYDNLLLEATGSKLDASFFKQHLQRRYLGD